MGNRKIITPRIVGFDDIDLSWALGRTINEVQVLEGAYTWCFSFDTERPAHFQVDCPWRILRGRRRILSVEDHMQRYGLPGPIDAAREASALLLGAVVQQISLQNPTADILIDLAGDLRVEIIPFSRGYEAWQLYDPFGNQYFEQGGRVTKWREDA